MLGAVATAGMLMASPMAAGAQQLELAFDHGRVTLKARGVTARQVLEEWARQGRTRVVNAEHLGEERVWIELDAVPEAQALQRILESAAGYVAGRRTDTDGRSDFGLILVLSSSEAASRKSPARPAPAAPDPVPDDDLAVVPPAESSTRHESESKLSEHERNGRSLDARPDSRLAGERDPGADIPAEKLSAGRPDGARPGSPVTLSAPPPAAAPVPVTGQPGGPAIDTNGRPPRKP